MKSRLLGAVSACVFTLTGIATAHAVPVSGQGTWETTLEGRLETAPGSGVFLAYYDTVLDMTWAANANINGLMNWSTANAWAAGLTLGGVSGWRLPTVSPINGSTFDDTFSNNATTDWGFAPTTTDGTDGGWRDVSNTPVSEMGHMYYVTLGNLGRCAPDDADPFSCIMRPGWGLSNTGPFSDIQPGSDVQADRYWSGTEFDSNLAWDFIFGAGDQDFSGKSFSDHYSWAVRSGDVPAVVPVPAALGLFGSGLLGLVGFARRKKVT
jgi:hypothetical protein